MPYFKDVRCRIYTFDFFQDSGTGASSGAARPSRRDLTNRGGNGGGGGGSNSSANQPFDRYFQERKGQLRSATGTGLAATQASSSSSGNRGRGGNGGGGEGVAARFQVQYCQTIFMISIAYFSRFFSGRRRPTIPEQVAGSICNNKKFANVE